MPPVPILILCGAAGDGKDAAADAILDVRPGSVKIAIADPMKRFCMKLFGFSKESLWGESVLRGIPIGRYADETAWKKARLNLDFLGNPLCQDLGIDPHEGLIALEFWFYALADEHVVWDYNYNGPARTGKWRPWEYNGQARITNLLTPRRALQTLGTEWGRTLKRSAWIDLALASAFRLLEGGCRYEATTGLIEDSDAPPANWVVISDGRVPSEPLAVKRAGGAAVVMENPTPRELVPGEHVSEKARLIPANRFDGILKNDRAHGLDALRGAAGEMMRDLEVGYGRWKTWDHTRGPTWGERG